MWTAGRQSRPPRAGKPSALKCSAGGWSLLWFRAVSPRKTGSGPAAFLRDNPPSAVVAFNDRSALGVIEGLRTAGLRVPSDVSVVGYDDSQFARLSYVQLTSVSQDAPLLATAAVDRAVDRLAGAEAPAHLVRTPHLVVRNTTAPAPAG